jgi:hypothetical protein
MGAVISAIRESLDNTIEEKRKQGEQLDFLVKASEAKLQVAEEDINNMFLNPEAVGKIQVIGSRALRFKRCYTIGVNSSSQAGIGSAVDSFFQGGKSDVAEGFKTLLHTSLDTILGNSSMGETNSKEFFVFVANNAIVRIDCRFWRYNFSNKGIIGTEQNAFCYTYCLSIVDHTKVSLDELTFLISEQCGGDLTKIQAYVDTIKKVWETLKSLDEKPKPVIANEAKNPRASASTRTNNNSRSNASKMPSTATYDLNYGTEFKSIVTNSLGSEEEPPRRRRRVTNEEKKG